MLVDKLLNYGALRKVICYIFWASECNDIDILVNEIPGFEKKFYSMDSLNILYSILNGSLSVKIFDENKIKIIKKLMNFYLEKYSSIHNEIISMCSLILKQVDNQKGKSNDEFYKEQYQIRTCKKCDTVTDELKKEIDERIVADIDTLKELLNIVNENDVNIDLNNEKTLSSIALFLYECPDIFYIQSISNVIINKLDEMDFKIEDETIDELSDFIAEKLLYINIYQSKLEDLAYNQTFISLISRNDLEAVINVMEEDSLENVFDEELLKTIELYLEENEKDCMFSNIQLNNILTLALVMHKMGIIDTQKLNDLKIRINQSINKSYNDKEYINKNRKYYEQLYKLYMGSPLYLNLIEESAEQKIKHGLDKLMTNTGGVLSDIIDFVVPEKLVCMNSDFLFHMNYIMNKYPMLLKDQIYSDRLKSILTEYQQTIDETKFNINKRQKNVYNKVKKKVEKKLR